MQKVKAFKNFFNPDYSWEDFIKSVNDGYLLDSEKNAKYEHKETIGKVNFWQKLTLSIDWADEKCFAGIEDKTDKLTKLFKEVSGFSSGRCSGKFALVSFTDKEPTTGKHSDPVHVIYCQFIGSVQWKVFEDNEEKTFILNPGDAIYIPREVEHEIKSLSSRAAISFMFEESS
jgi:mannose-6-phosphate isomerase-like protein (cupin superfamily)